MTSEDFERFWGTFSQIVQAQETYALDAEVSYQHAFELWCARPLKTFIFESQGDVRGSYYLKANGEGPSGHICNCGYMVKAAFQGQGIAKRLCEHSQAIAKELGFKAMQFNSVVSSNMAAVHLWKTLGYQIIGTIPKGYQHRQLGYVDCYVMHKFL
jgi:ribosomal protein S18 acetylase RimI-like enzyme